MKKFIVLLFVCWTALSFDVWCNSVSVHTAIAATEVDEVPVIEGGDTPVESGDFLGE